MKRTIFIGILALAAGISGLMAQAQPAGQAAPPAQATPPGQTAQPAQPAPAVQAGPRPKSQEEVTALQALFSAQKANDADGVIKAAEDLVTKFADTDFKEAALTMEAAAYRMKGDSIHSQVTWERVLQVNPKSIQGNLQVGELITAQTKEKDFDREEKLGQAEKYFKTTLDLLTQGKPNPQLTDEQWDAAKKSVDAEVHNNFGLIAMIRKKNDVAVDEFKIATTEDPEQQAYQARLASALLDAGKQTEAVAECDKMLANPNLNPTIKTFVNNVKAAASKPPAK